MSTALWVAAGGAFGSLARFAIADFMNGRSHPWGTVTVNLLGSFVLGLLIGLWGFRLEHPHQVGVTVGLLGGFTTFSTFALDTVRLWEDGRASAAVLTVGVSVLVGLAAAVAGLLAGRSLSG